MPRKAGWDTHGLPVEIEVEKELRISGKEAIERYGVEPFVRRCLESVFRYTEEWQGFTEKLGFWIDMPDAYVTYHRSYVESVWWALSQLFARGLLYRGHKVVWWWAQGGTVLSAAEVGEGYRTVDDPSVYVRFPLEDEPDTSLLVWTTTPWTPALQQLRRGGARGALRGAPRRRAAPDRGRGPAGDPGREGRPRAAGGAQPGGERAGRPALPPALRLVRGAPGGGPVACGGRRLRGARLGDRHRARGPGLRRGGLRAAPTAAGGRPGPAPALRRAPGWRLRSGGGRRRLRRALGEGGRPRSDPRAAGPRAALARRAGPPRLPLLRALRRRSADPVRAARLVHPHHRPRRRLPGQQRPHPVAARAHPRRALRRLPAQQHRLGGVPRALLGHAPQRLGERRDRQHGGAGFGAGDPGPQPGRLRGLRARPGRGSLHLRAPDGAQALDRRGDLDPRGRARHLSSGARGDRRLVRLGLDALRPVGLSAPGRRGVRAELPRRLHLRGHRPDPGLVQLAALDLHSALPGARQAPPLQELHRAGPRGRPQRQEGVEEQGQLHAAGSDPGPGAAAVRRGGGSGAAGARLRPRGPGGLRGPSTSPATRPG